MPAMRILLSIIIGSFCLTTETLHATPAVEYFYPSFGTPDHLPAVLVDLSQGRLLFVSAQWPIDSQTGEKVEGSIQEATIQALDNVQCMLKAGGTNFSYVLRMDVVLNNMKDLPLMNEAYAQYFQRIAPPAKHTTQCNIPVRIEISCVAFVPTPPRCLECEKTR